jgi:Cobyrinic acid a,c-diamide synthase
MKLEKPRILVAGVASDVGKTTVATGLMACFRKKD